MTAVEKVAVLERMRALLADPDRVVLDPLNCFEDPGTGLPLSWTPALRHSCRACLCGAATIAAFDVTGSITDTEIREWLAEKATELAIPVAAAALEALGWSEDAEDDPVVILTSALMQGRALEVIDACLDDTRAHADWLEVAA